MKRSDVHRYDMLTRVSTFGTTHRDLFPASSFGGRMFKALGEALDQMRTHIDSEASGRSAARRNAASKADARKSLWNALDQTARIARAIEDDTPAVRDKFRLPKRTDHEIVTAARAFATDAAPLSAVFVGHGLRHGFVADLRAKADTLEKAALDNGTSRERRAAARAGIAAAFDLATAALRRLDVIVPNGVVDDPSVRAAWSTARRVPRVRTGPEADAPAPSPTVPPTPSTASGDAAHG